MMRELGMAPSVVGVATAYRDLAATLVIDEVDRDLVDAVEAEGVRAVVTETVMHDRDVAAALARVVLDAGRPDR